LKTIKPRALVGEGARCTVELAINELHFAEIGAWPKDGERLFANARNDLRDANRAVRDDEERRVAIAFIEEDLVLSERPLLGDRGKVRKVQRIEACEEVDVT